jgi:hypothetical protein
MESTGLRSGIRRRQWLGVPALRPLLGAKHSMLMK